MVLKPSTRAIDKKHRSGVTASRNHSQSVTDLRGPSVLWLVPMPLKSTVKKSNATYQYCQHLKGICYFQ